MTEVSSERSALAPVIEPPVGPIRALVGVQLYVVTAYLATAVVPYVWAPRPHPPAWMLIVPGWLLGVPGFYITLAGAGLAVPLIAAGVAVLLLGRRGLSRRLLLWCTVSTALVASYALFALTALGHTLQAFVGD